ncbi:MAG: VCBS repeat-containing protein, partial [Candidatus Firestonebacteria bacterium]|nr:VCBS repeat-containing protein [Candidatus Firestonebacteria bacterium]
DWNKYNLPSDFRYYRIYKSQNNFNNVEDIIVYDTGIEKNYVLSNLLNNEIYYIAVTAVDTNYNENRQVTPVTVTSYAFREFNISFNLTAANIYIDGNYAYTGKLIGEIQKYKFTGRTTAKKHFMVLEDTNGIYMNYNKLIDLSSEIANLNITLSSAHSTKYNFSSVNKLLYAKDELPSPFIVDWDNDGNKDILIGSKKGEIQLYLNTGTDSSPVLTESVPLYMGNLPLNVGEESVPFAVDWNNDSKKDLLIGTKNGLIYLLKNIGTDDNPLFNDTTSIYATEEESITPFVIDWNEDKRKDIVFGTKKGDVYYILNTGTDDNPLFYSSSPKKITNLSISSHSAPFFINWNYKGKKDIVSGNEKGNIEIYDANNKVPPSFIFDTLFISNNSGYSKPFIVDWNNDSIWDIIVGEKNGNISIYYGEEIKIQPPKESSHKSKFCILTTIFDTKNNYFIKIRDKFLLKSHYGRKLTNIYYSFYLFNLYY